MRPVRAGVRHDARRGLLSRALVLPAVPADGAATMRHVLAAIVLIALVVASWAIRLQNPTLTETQLLIEYWPLWLAIVAVALITAWWYKRK